MKRRKVNRLIGEFVRGDGRRKKLHIDSIKLRIATKGTRLEKKIGNASGPDKMVSALSQDTKPALRIAKQ